MNAKPSSELETDEKIIQTEDIVIDARVRNDQWLAPRTENLNEDKIDEFVVDRQIEIQEQQDHQDLNPDCSPENEDIIDKDIKETLVHNDIDNQPKQDDLEEINDEELDNLCESEPQEENKMQAEESLSEDEWIGANTNKNPTTHQNDTEDIPKIRVITKKSPVRSNFQAETSPIRTPIKYQSKLVDSNAEATKYHEEALRTPIRSQEPINYHTRSSDQKKRNKYKGKKSFSRKRVINGCNEEAED